MRIEETTARYLNELLDTKGTIPTTAKQNYTIARVLVEGSQKRYCLVEFLSPKGLRIKLQLNTGWGYEIPLWANMEVWVEKDENFERLFEGYDTRDINPKELRTLIETVLKDLTQSGKEQLIALHKRATQHAAERRAQMEQWKDKL
jgi:hypothetical protein